MVSAILAGGQNSRLPFLKGFIDVGGRRLIEANIGLLRAITGEVVISTNKPEVYFHLGVPLIGDVVEPAGPMTGILSVLLGTGAPEVLVTACDMPFLNPELIRYIIGRRGGDATVPVFGGRPQPLLAVYSESAKKTIEEMLKTGRRALGDLLGELDARYIEEEDIRRIDPEGRSFVNINTIEDFQRAFPGGKKCSV